MTETEKQMALFNVRDENGKEIDPESIEEEYEKEQDTANEKELKESMISANNGTAVHREIANVVRYYNKKIHSIEKSKKEKYRLYKEMDGYPEVSNAIDEICDEGITKNDRGDVSELDIDNPEVSEKKRRTKTLNEEYDFVMGRLLNLNDNAWRWFREFIVFAEIFFGTLWDEDNPEDGLTSVKKYSNLTTHANFNNGTGELKSFIMKDKDGKRIDEIDKEIAAYQSSGNFQYVNIEKEGKIEKKKKSKQIKIPVSFLEKARRPFYHLRQIEDAIVIYRIIRAPERLVFNVDCGDMPPKKANEYVRNMARRYKTDIQYNPETGAADTYANVKSMLENYFFIKTSNGKGVNVESLSGGQNLGQIDDIKYFQRKLYRALKIPIGRMEEKYTYRSGDMSQLTRQEVKFSSFVQRLTSRFAKIFEDIFFRHLKLKGYVEKFDLRRNDINIRFYPSNLFRQFRELQLMEKKSRIFQTFSSHTGDMFSVEYILRKYLDMDDEEIEYNRKLREKENEEKDDDDGGRRF